MDDTNDLTPDERRIAEAADRMEAQGVPSAQIDAFVQRAMSRLTKNAAEQSSAQRPTTREKVGGSIASLVRDIPAGEAITAGLGMLKGQGYDESLAALRRAENAAPKAVSVPARIGGAVAAMSATAPSVVANAATRLGAVAESAPWLQRLLATVGKTALAPRTAAQRGARYGATLASTAADKESVGDRVKRVVIDAASGAVGGKAGEFVGTAIRAGTSKTLGAVSQEMKALRRAIDKVNYSAAEAEGNAATNQAILDPVLNANGIKQYADKVRNSKKFAGADNATIARETYKLMSRTEGKLGKQIEGSPDFLADIEMQKADIGIGKKDLLTGAEPVMPSLPKAISEHADEMGKKKAFERMSDATKNLVLARDVAGKNLETQSPEAVLKEIESLTPEQAKAGVRGVLARIKDIPEFTSNPVSGFGVVSSTARIPIALLRTQPYLRALDAKAGTGGLSRLLEQLGIGTASTIDAPVGGVR